MNRLVDDLIPKVITYLGLKEKHSLCCAQKNYLQVGKQHLKQQIQDKKNGSLNGFLILLMNS